MSTFDQRMTLEVAREKAIDLQEALVLPLGQMEHWEFAGSLRRRSKTVGDLDLIVVPPTVPNLLGEAALEPLSDMGWPEWATAKEKRAYGWYEPEKASRVMMDVFACPRESVGAMRWFLTGPPDLNVCMRQKATAKGLLLNQYGVFVAVSSPTKMHPERMVPGDRVDPPHDDFDMQELEIPRTIGIRNVPVTQRDLWRKVMFDD